MRETTDIKFNQYGDETHQSFGVIGASRLSISPPGSSLFDSDIQHSHTVMVRIKAASRKRELHHDWIHGGKEYIEIEMSEAQWASFVSSMNVGDGVPCTVRSINLVSVPGAPHEPRLAHSMAETREAAHEAFDDIQKAMDAFDALDPKAPAKERREALNNLRSVIRNSVPNVDFAGKSLAEHAENVVTKARADVEAFVVAKANQLGIDTSELAGPGILHSVNPLTDMR